MVVGKCRGKVQPWVTEILGMCGAQRKLKKVRSTTGADEYKKVNKHHERPANAKKKLIESNAKK